MKSNTSIERSWFFVGIGGITFSIISFIAIFFLGGPPKSSLPVSGELPQSLVRGESIESAAPSAGLGLPVRLKIPKIYVVAEVEHVGLTASGDVGVPKSQENVAWFKLGPRPGEKGSSVIDGHYGSKDGGSVFDDLHKLTKGDKVYVENDNGEMVSFVVVGSKRYDPNADAKEVFGSSDGKAHLNLITCEGVWDEDTKNYSRRLVVFTDKEE